MLVDIVRDIKHKVLKSMYIKKYNVNYADKRMSI